MDTLTLEPGSPRGGELRPPPSKSDALRSMVLAHARGLPAELALAGLADLPRDVLTLREGLAALVQVTSAVMFARSPAVSAPVRIEPWNVPSIRTAPSNAS